MNTARATFFACASLTLFCIASGTPAQEKTHVARPIFPARAEDVSTIEGIVKASYEAICGGGGPRDWGRDRTLFDPNSRV